MANQDGPPKGTVMTSAVLQENCINFLLEKVYGKLRIAGVNLGMEQAEEFLELVNDLNAFVADQVQMGIANRVNLQEWTTTKTKTLVTADPDDSQSDQEGVIYELRYHMATKRADGTEQQNIFTYDEAVDRFGEGAVSNMWGTFGERGTYTEDFGGTLYGFTTIRYPVKGEFAPTIQTEQQVREEATQGMTQADSHKGVDLKGETPEQDTQTVDPWMGGP